MLRYRLAFLVFINFLILLSSPVLALPLRARQNAPTTLQTVHTTQTIAGPLTETCVITLTPITDKDGKPAVEEVKRCTLGYTRSDTGDGGTSSSVASTESPSGSSESSINTSTTPSTATIATLASSDTNPSPTTPSVSSSPSSSPTATTTASGAATTSVAASSVSATAPTSGLVVHGVSTVSGTPTQTGTPTTSTPAASTVPTTTSPTNQQTPTSVTAGADNASASTTDPAAASAAAAEQASESPEPFQLPGKKLSVLPIGLGVFAGISVIALIVVGLVTYERTKYRKAFRARKLAESGGTMGYGGMAQRS